MTRWLAAICFAIGVTLVAPCASACLAKQEGGFAFWDNPPADLAPGEVALEVEFMGEASSVHAAYEFDPHADEKLPPPQHDGEASARAGEYPFQTSCGGFVAYRVKRVLRGKFEGQAVLVGPLLLMLDETWNPLRKRILVGTPEARPIKAALTAVKDWREHVFFGAHMDVRLARAFEPTALEKALMLPELVVFGIARLIGYGVSFVPGLGAAGVSPWIGVMLLLMLLGGIAWLILRPRKRRAP